MQPEVQHSDQYSVAGRCSLCLWPPEPVMKRRKIRTTFRKKRRPVNVALHAHRAWLRGRLYEKMIEHRRNREKKTPIDQVRLERAEYKRQRRGRR